MKMSYRIIIASGRIGGIKTINSTGSPIFFLSQALFNLLCLPIFFFTLFNLGACWQAIKKKKVIVLHVLLFGYCDCCFH